MAYRRTERVVQRLHARRDAIVAAARELAAEDGMEAVQIAPVASHAGVAAGTVYRYFPSKNDLVAALIEAHIETELTALRSAANAAPGALSALAAAIVACAARALRARRLTFAIMVEPVDRDIAALRGKQRSLLAAEFAARTVAAIAGGHLPEQDAGLASAALLGVLLEGLVGSLAPQATDDAKAREMVQAVALIALRGLGVMDARARGLVVQAAWPKADAA